MPIKVLLLDDEPDNTLLLRTTITRSSYGDEVQCISFRTGKDALVWCKENSVDLCIVDYNMPDMDGLEFIQALRKIDSYRFVPIAVFSAHIEEAFHVRIRRGGADDLIEKSTDFIKLRKRIHAYIDIHKKYLEYSQYLETLSNGDFIPGELPANELQQAIRQLGLAFMKSQDNAEHFIRVARLAEIIAHNMGLSNDFCEKIFYTAPFHDIGRHLLPEEMWEEVFEKNNNSSSYLPLHTIMGGKLIAASKLKDADMAAEIAMGHHERFDGRGYPYALSGEDIPLSARIVAVADSLDLYLSHSVGAKITISEALHKLESMSGNELDPVCVAALMQSEDLIAEILNTSVSHPAFSAQA